MSPCPECGMMDGAHWHWCKQEPIEKWTGFYRTRIMTREELEEEFPRSDAANGEAKQESK